MLVAGLSVSAFADDTAANPETTLVATNEADEDVRLLKDVFQKAVYVLSEDGVMKGALSFHTETEGIMYTVSADKIVTEPFTVEYTDDGIVFHFGGVDNVTPTVCDGNGITFDFGDAGVVTYEVNLKDDTTPEDFDKSMETLGNEDSDTFEVEAPADAAILEEENTSVSITDTSVAGESAVAFVVTGDEIKSASESSDFTLYLKFNSVTPFSVKAHVKLTSGAEKLYTIEGSGKNAESWFPMQSMLDALHITADEIDKIELDGDANFKGASFTNVYTSGKSDENPATGVGFMAVPALMSCAAMMLSRKRK